MYNFLKYSSYSDSSLAVSRVTLSFRHADCIQYLFYSLFIEYSQCWRCQQYLHD